MVIKEGDIIQSRYRLVSLKGRGAFGEVWLAKDEQTDLDVAVKVYIALDDRGLEEFKAEYKNSYSLNHPNLLHAYHFDVVDRQPFLVMPYCPDSAESLVGNADEKTLLRFIKDVASGLEFLHSKDIIHRDIKPDNVLINKEGNFLITDFGVSSKMKSTLRRNSTRAMSGNDIAGTIGYMAPELFSRTPDAVKATDIWALGATIYEMASGELPFFGQGGALLLRGADVPELRGEWSDGFRNIVEACLAKETWDRPTAAKLVSWCEALLNGNAVPGLNEKRSEEPKSHAGSEKNPAPVPEKKKEVPKVEILPPDEPKRHFGGWIGVLLALVVVGLVVAVFPKKEKVKVTEPTPAHVAEVELPSGNNLFYGTVWMRKDGSTVRIKKIDLNFDSGSGKSYYSDSPLTLRIVEKRTEGSFVKLKIEETNTNMTKASKLGGKVTSVYDGYYDPKEKSIKGKGRNWHGEEFTFIFSPGKAPWTDEKVPSSKLEETRPGIEANKEDASVSKESELPVTESVPSKGSSAKISRTSIEIKEGETYQLSVSGAPDLVSWVSDNESVAYVGTAGLVKGMSAGSTKVRAWFDDVVLTCSVKVKKGSSYAPSSSPSTPKAIAISQETASLKVGERITLKITGYDGSFEWESDNPSIATVSQSGVVEGVKAGNTLIWAKITGGNYKQCRVTVRESAQSSSGKKVISGKVYDTNGKPLSGISVKIKGSSYGATTNSSGYYSLMAQPGDYLVVSGTGYKTIEKYVPVSTSELEFTMSSLSSTPSGSNGGDLQSASQTKNVSSTKKIAGYVRDGQGTPIVGAAVMIRGTNTGTITNIDGVYSINAKEGDVLLVSCKGYQDVAKTVGSESRIDVTMSQGKSKRR